MARKRVHGDSGLTGRVRRSLSAHRGYRTRAHSTAQHANAVSRLEDAHDELCVLSSRAVPPLPAVPPVPAKGAARAAVAGLRADYGPHSGAVFKADKVVGLGGGPVEAGGLGQHLRDLSDWYRGEVDRSVGMGRRAKGEVRRHADAVLTANLAGLHHLRLASLNDDGRFAVLAGAGLQRW